MSVFNFQERASPREEKAIRERRINRQKEKELKETRNCDLIFSKQVEYLLSKYGSVLTVEETAKELKVSKDLIYDLVNRKELHSKKAGDRRVIPTADLVYWLVYEERM